MPVRVLTLFESGPTAAGAAALRLLAALPSGRVAARGIDLRPSPARDPNGSIDRVPYRYALDVTGLRDVRRVAAEFRPDVVHTFGPLALRVSVVARPRRLAVSHADRARDPFTRWRVRTADRILVHTAAERDRYERAGAGRERIVDIPIGVDAPDPGDRVAVRTERGLGPKAILIVASGRFDPNAGLRYAVWAFDMVRHVYPEARLVLIGDGPERPRLERFAESLGGRPFVTFAGPRADAARVIAAADCVWLTHREGGTTVGYEALAAGVPVRGFATPDSSALPVPRSAFVPYGDPAALAVATCRDIDAPAPGFPLSIPVSTMADAVAGVYDSLVTR